MAQAATVGARTELALQVSLRRAQDTHATDLIAASGYIFATPENLGSMSGQMKDFFDRTYYAALDQLDGRPYAAIICAGSDGRNAAHQVERVATGWRLKRMADSLIACTHAQTREEILRPKIIPKLVLQQCEALGATLASGIAMGIF